jgi:hypothetical protein
MDSVATHDIVLLVVAGYVSVITLVRMMRNKHHELMSKLRKELREEQRRISDERKSAAKKPKVA